jgi:hypothetical protein
MMSASLLAAAIASAGCDGAAPAAAAGAEGKVDDLAAEIKALRELIPDQAHIMADVGYHFTNLWFAGEAENWPLAAFYLGETKSHLRWAVRWKPIRKDNAGRDVNLPNILEAFENSQLTQLQQAVDRKGGGLPREPHVLLRLPQGVGQAVSPAASPRSTRRGRDQLRPQGRLAAIGRRTARESG